MTGRHDDTDGTPSDGNLADGDRVAASTSYKLLGELDESGTGILGRNTAASGAPVGVEGTVPNAEGGDGLSTPDDARVGGTAELSGLGGSLTGSRPVTDLLGAGLAVSSETLSAAPVRLDVEDGDTTVAGVTELSLGSRLAVTDDGDGTVTVDRE